MLRDDLNIQIEPLTSNEMAFQFKIIDSIGGERIERKGIIIFLTINLFDKRHYQNVVSFSSYGHSSLPTKIECFETRIKDEGEPLLMKDLIRHLNIEHLNPIEVTLAKETIYNEVSSYINIFQNRA